MPQEAAILGSCSLLLTVVNILCIIVMALIILRIKEVIPLHQESKEIAQFFHHDVKVARGYNKTITDKDNIHNKKYGSSGIGTIVLSKSIAKHWKGLIPSSKDQNLSVNTQQYDIFYSTNLTDLNHLQTYAKDFHLDVFRTEDRELTTAESQEKVLCLVNSILDIYEEDPAAFIDLSRFQPYGAQTSARKEQTSFYEHLIELLPPKWYGVFHRERRRRNNMGPPNKRRSISFTVPSVHSLTRSRLNQSLNALYNKNESESNSSKKFTNRSRNQDKRDTVSEIDLENFHSKY